MPSGEVRSAPCSCAAVSAQCCGGRAQRREELPAAERELICAQCQQEPQGKPEMLSKCSWEPASWESVAGSFPVITLELVSWSFGQSACFLQMYEERLKPDEITV